MEAIAHKPGHLHAGILSLIAAVSAVSVTIVSYQGASASRYALFCIGLLGLVLLCALAYVRPLTTLIIALIFVTSPIPLLLSQPQSALVSAFLLAGASLGFALRTPLRSIAPDPMILPIGIFVAYGVVSAAYGLWAGNQVGYLLGDCFQVLEFALVYFLVTQLLSNQARVQLVLRILFGTIMFTILLELVLFALGPVAGDLLPFYAGTSVSEPLVRTININATILFALLFNLYPIIRSRRQRFWIWIALIPTVANIALSLSRGLWVCTLVAVVVSFLLQGGRARARLAKAFAVTSICVLFLAAAWKIGSDSDGSLLSVLEERVFHGVDQVEEGFAGTESMATRRFLEISIVAPQVLASPWMGHGLGATYVVGGFAVLDAGTDAPIDHHFIHNLYLVTAFRMGIIGLGLLLWVFLRYIRRTRRACSSMPLGPNRALLVGLVASVVGQLVLSVTEPTITQHPTSVLIACAMALSFRLAAASPDCNPHTQMSEFSSGV